MHVFDGQKALDILHKFPTKFNVVVLDIIMPVMDGMETLKYIKVCLEAGPAR